MAWVPPGVVLMCLGIVLGYFCVWMVVLGSVVVVVVGDMMIHILIPDLHAEH